MTVGNGIAREWQRYTRRERLGRFALYFGIVLACVASLRTVEIIPEFLYDAPEQVADLLRRMWPVEWHYYPKGVHEVLIETLHIATLGTILAILMALPLGVLAANNLTPSTTLNYFAKFLLVSSRSVNSLVWALLFVAIFGPGALAGTMAIAFRSIGFVGKLFSEALEETQPGPVEALRSCGASWLSVFIKGYWPQVEPAFWAIALFRWDISVRESAVLGLVGAGGIGMAIDSAMNLFQWQRVALMLVVIFVVVLLAEIVVTAIRKRII
ncbi:MAG: phosphonate ABC transporter, permease protein PhnE [Burkholderiales bacterium]|jgi:phosphonate transport system permease protein|nr:phosphonate ABC transporter, permease protein PhnE [Burkholderiales bacterium]